MPYDLNHQNSTIKTSSVSAASLAQQPASLPLTPGAEAQTRGPEHEEGKGGGVDG